MAEWVVKLGTPGGRGGFDTVPVEADFVEDSEDGEWIVFRTLTTFDDALEALRALMDKDASQEQLRDELFRLVRAVEQSEVARFKKADVAGYSLAAQPGGHVRSEP